MSRLGFALGCCWATRVIAHEHRVVAVAASATGTTNEWNQSRRDSGFLPRHSVTVVSVLAFHLGIFGVVLIGLGGKIKHLTPPRLEITELPVTQRPRPPIELPQPERMSAAVRDPVILTMPFPVPIPVSPEVPNEDQRGSPGPTADSQPATIPTAAVHQVSRVTGGPGTGFPSTADYYPSLSRFRAEQGVATVRVCVDRSGRLTAEPTLVEGSGVRRLDESALRLARAGSGHYRASTENGVPINSCYAFRVHFALKDG
jgi:TonB family protein